MASTTDATILKRREQFLALREKRHKDDLAFVMSTAQGRRFMWDLLYLDCGLLDLYEGSDPEGMFRHEGKRGVGHVKAKELQTIVPEHYVLMVNERLLDEAKAIQSEAAKTQGDHNA